MRKRFQPQHLHTFSAEWPCKTCNATGFIVEDGEKVICWECGGSKKVEV